MQVPYAHKVVRGGRIFRRCPDCLATINTGRLHPVRPALGADPYATHWVTQHLDSRPFAVGR